MVTRPDPDPPTPLVSGIHAHYVGWVLGKLQQTLDVREIVDHAGNYTADLVLDLDGVPVVVTVHPPVARGRRHEV
jgi:hypothetical protein